MKRLLLIATVALLAIVTPSVAHAQIQLGLGIGAPVVGRDIPTSGHIDSTGIVTIDSHLDTSPQIIVEVHRTFKVHEKLGVGPYLGFAPKIDFGTAANSTSETPLGAGFGLLVSTDAGAKHRINLGLMWLVTTPITEVNPAWKNGYQAPRTSQGIPIDLKMERTSVNRLMFTLTVSGLL